MRLLRDRHPRPALVPAAPLLAGALVAALGLSSCVDGTTADEPNDDAPIGQPVPGASRATDGEAVGEAALEAPPVEHTLTVATAGDGGGTVASADERIACGPSCQAKVYDGEYVTLHATPAVGATFRGWFGEGCLQATPCTVTVRRAMTLTAYFTVDDPSSVPGQP
jgi:hypothetical protein